MAGVGVYVGQRWQKRTRFKTKPELAIVQVHRADREAETLRELDGGQTVRERIKFAELRRHYRLVQQSPAVHA
jgi:hypothetical protein